jgi:hypothetical protein
VRSKTAKEVRLAIDAYRGCSAGLGDCEAVVDGFGYSVQFDTHDHSPPPVAEAVLDVPKLAWLHNGAGVNIDQAVRFVLPTLVAARLPDPVAPVSIRTAQAPPNNKNMNGAS